MSKNDPLKKLYSLGSDRVHKDLSLEKLIKSYKDLKLMMKDKLPLKVLKKKLQKKPKLLH